MQVFIKTNQKLTIPVMPTYFESTTRLIPNQVNLAEDNLVLEQVSCHHTRISTNATPNFKNMFGELYEWINGMFSL